MDKGAWRATAHGVPKSRTRLSNFIIYLSIYLHSTGLLSSFLGIDFISKLPCIEVEPYFYLQAIGI